MQISLDRSSATPLYRQLVKELRGQIIDGRLAANYRLPPERELATMLGVNRDTVLQAYRQLKDDGLIVSHVGKGTFVSPGVRRDATAAPPWAILFSDYSNRFTYHDLASADKAQSKAANAIDFATGSPNPADIPDDLLRDISLDAFSSHDFDGQPESPIEGFSELRELLASHMRDHGVHCAARNIMVLSGSEQGIDLCVRAFINPGDTVLVEQSTFFPALQAFRSADARLVGVPVDKDGMRTDLLDGYCARYHPKLIYTIPTFHNPTGSTMPMQRRRELIDVAMRYQCLILEDDPYGELRYDTALGESPTPLKGMENSGYVIYLSTFSKTVTPGLRTGWMVADPHVIGRLAALRRMVDQHTSSSSQRICIELLRGDKIRRHIDGLTATYRHRRDLICAALERYAPSGTVWERPAGGYYVWVSLPEGVKSQRLLESARRVGVTFMPGGVFDVDGEDDSHIRLNFVRPDVDRIETGVRLLCGAIGPASVRL